MSSRGQSLSVFVVQRSFRRVRRGYDPDEVDRHLQLVSEWFTKTDAGERAREYERSLRERERAAEEAERRLGGERLEAGATLEGARLKAAASAAEAEELLEAAREEASAILDR